MDLCPVERASPEGWMRSPRQAAGRSLAGGWRTRVQHAVVFHRWHTKIYEMCRPCWRRHKVQRTIFEYSWWQNYDLKIPQRATAKPVLASWNLTVLIIRQPEEEGKSAADEKVCKEKTCPGTKDIHALEHTDGWDPCLWVPPSSSPGWRSTALKIFPYCKLHMNQ